MLMLLGFLVALGLFIAELAKIHYAAYRRRCIRGDLDQVHAAGASEVESVTKLHDAELFAFQPDNPNFTGTDFPIYPDKRTGRRRRPWGKRATQDTLVSWNLFMQFIMDHRHFNQGRVFTSKLRVSQANNCPNPLTGEIGYSP